MTKAFSALTEALGSYIAALAAFLLVVLWAASYPVWSDGDTWMLIINTSTTIITFLMVFVIQNTQNRDGRAIQAKLDLALRMQAVTCVHLGLAPELVEEAWRLIGIEDEKSKVIKTQQARVRHELGENTQE